MDGWSRERLRVRVIGVVRISRWTDGVERLKIRDIGVVRISRWTDGVEKRLRIRDIGVVRISRWTDGVERGSESEISELLESAGGPME